MQSIVNYCHLFNITNPKKFARILIGINAEVSNWQNSKMTKVNKDGK